MPEPRLAPRDWLPARGAELIGRVADWRARFDTLHILYHRGGD